VSRLHSKPVHNRNKQRTMLAAEACAKFIGEGHAEQAERSGEAPLKRNPFHRGSRCWHAFERGYRNGFRCRSQAIAIEKRIPISVRRR
jgi:hypothetical protein